MTQSVAAICCNLCCEGNCWFYSWNIFVRKSKDTNSNIFINKQTTCQTTYNLWVGCVKLPPAVYRGEREWLLGREGNGKETFPKYGNGKRVEKKHHPQNSKMGRVKIFPNFGNRMEMKNLFPKSGSRNQRLSFPGTAENRNGNGKKKKWYVCIKNIQKIFGVGRSLRPKYSQPHPPPFLTIPTLIAVVTAAINNKIIL